MSGASLICHKDIMDQLYGLSKHAFICNNGHKQLMSIPRGYVAPREGTTRCEYKARATS